MSEKMIDQHIYFDKVLHDLIAAEVNTTGKNFSQVVRELCRDGLTHKNAIAGIDIIQSSLRSVTKDVMKPIEERLAKIEAKTAIAAATSMYLNLEAVSHIVGQEDAIEFYNNARKKAVNYVRTPEEEKK